LGASVELHNEKNSLRSTGHTGMDLMIPLADFAHIYINQFQLPSGRITLPLLTILLASSDNIKMVKYQLVLGFILYFRIANAN
jgi:hypothetical protein